MSPNSFVRHVASPASPLWVVGETLNQSVVWNGRFSMRMISCPALSLDRSGAADLLLQHQHAVEQRLGRGRAARHVDVDRHDAVAAAHYRIGIVVIAAAIGARAHRDDVTRR